MFAQKTYVFVAVLPQFDSFFVAFDGGFLNLCGLCFSGVLALLRNR